MSFEKHMQQDCEDIKSNVSMQEGSEARHDKGKQASWNNDDHDEEAMDHEQHHKKDTPPRFSTLFGATSAPVPFIPQMEEPRRRRSGGIFLSWPALILLGLLLFFETVALFAYTAIGLYNNMPDRFLNTGHSTSAALDMAAPAAQAPVNIAPNFVIGSGEHVTVTQTVTIYLPSPFGMQAVNTGASSTSEPVKSSSTAPSVPVVTVTPGGGTATSIVLVTHTAESTSTAGRPTSFVTEFVAPSILSVQQAARSRVAELASKAADAVRQEASSSSTSSSTTAPTTSSITSSSTLSISSSTTTTSAPEEKGTNGACFGGAGAVFQNCQ